MKLPLLIATPLEPEQVARIEAFAPERLDVMFAPDLLPAARFVADHQGEPRKLDETQRSRWRAMVARAVISFDFDWEAPSDFAKNAPHLRWVQATSAGIGEFLRSSGLDRSGIAFTTASGVHARPLAEFVVLGLLHLRRDVPLLLRWQREHRWRRYTAKGLEGCRMLLVGTGAIGGEIAARCADMGVRVWGMRREAGGDPPPGIERMVARDELSAALAEVDALVLACPLTPATTGLIGAAELSAMRKGAFLINVARGQVVDEPALIEALRSGQLGGAVLDVATVEPLPRDSPLWDMENVLISPHSASTVDIENKRIVDIFLDNLDRFFGGGELRNRFDPERGY